MEKNEQTFKELQKKLQPIFEKIGLYFTKLTEFLYKHKVATIIVAILVFLICSVVAVGNHYLDKINYDDGSTPPSVIYTEEATTQVQLGTGEYITINVSQMNPDGSFTLSDGRIYYTDGAVRNPDGSFVFKDGSYLTADGIAVLSDGTTIYRDGNVVFQDGSFLPASGIVVDASGNAAFFDGAVKHISEFLIDKSGKVIIKSDGNNVLQIGNNIPSQAPTTQPPVSNTEEDDKADDIIQAAKDNNKLKEELKQNDKLIEENAHNDEIWYSDDVINILLMGIDKGSKNYPYGRSDAMIIVSINKITKKIKLISLSRAAYVAIDGYANTRLNHAHGYGGAQLAIKTIEDSYKIRIDNYISTTFDAFKELIDAVGGVVINLTKKEASALKSKLKENGYEYIGAGAYNLNGPMALEYVRLRKIDTDRDRTQRQRNVLTALANKAKSMNVLQLNLMLNRVLPYITTDLTKTEIVSQLVNVPTYLSSDFEQHVLPHKSTKLTLIDNFEVLLIDWKDEVKYAHKTIYEGVTPSYYKR